MEEEKEEEREELDMNCGGITPTSLGSVTNWCQFFLVTGSFICRFLVARQINVSSLTYVVVAMRVVRL